MNTEMKELLEIGRKANIAVNEAMRKRKPKLRFTQTVEAFDVCADRTLFFIPITAQGQLGGILIATRR